MKCCNRKHNLDLFGFPDNDKTNNVELATNDNNDNLCSVVKNVLNKFISSTDLENVCVHRIGKTAQVQNPRPRPIKIICATEERAQVVLKTFVAAKKNAMHSQELKEYWMTNDKTKMQQEEIRAVKEELILHQQGGEENLSVVFRRGVPTIVKRPLMRQ